MPYFSRLVSLLLLGTLVVGSTPGTAQGMAPAEPRQRIFSTLGFSFLPPQGADWSEQFDKNQITYFKKTDPALASFYAGALEGRLQSQLTDRGALVAFVRSKKDQWGADGRYSSVSSSFRIEEKLDSCVSYRLAARDHDAKNKGRNAYLQMQVVGRFCVHPRDRASAVDVFYSIRHAPTFDSSQLAFEGEAFIQGLALEKRP